MMNKVWVAHQKKQPMKKVQLGLQKKEGNPRAKVAWIKLQLNCYWLNIRKTSDNSQKDINEYPTALDNMNKNNTIASQKLRRDNT